jgi:hypothetical protein
VVKFGFASEVTEETVPLEDDRDKDIAVPGPATVMYGGLKRLWFHSADTIGNIPIESELENTDELIPVSIKSP